MPGSFIYLGVHQGIGTGVILLTGATNNTIGGTGAGATNIIAFNAGDGVSLFASALNGNAILTNNIYANTELGIDLSGGVEDGFGVTDNDANDSDAGPNALMNFPVITVASESGGIGTGVTVVGIVIGDAKATTSAPTSRGQAL